MNDDIFLLFPNSFNLVVESKEAKMATAVVNWENTQNFASPPKNIDVIASFYFHLK